MTFNDAQKLLDKNNQAQVLRYFDSLNEAEKQGLLKQIENINWSDLGKIGSTYYYTAVNTDKLKRNFTVV